MIVIPFFAILNAYWGQRPDDAPSKWLCLPAAFIAVFAVSHDWKLSLAWAVYFMVWRIRSLSKEGFKVTDPDKRIWREGAKFMLMRSGLLQGLLILGYGILKQFDIYRPEMLYMAAFPLIVAAIYSGVGYFYPITLDRHNRRIRWVEYACGFVLGLLIAVTV